MRGLFWWRPPCVLRSVIVNFTDDPSTAIKGVLWASRGPYLTFKTASILKPNAEPATVDGDVVIHRDRISFLQVLP
jgi:hypothetical protein